MHKYSTSLRTLVAAAVALSLVAASASTGTAQSGSASAAIVAALGVNASVASATMPGGGGYSTDEQLSTVLSPISSGVATAMTVGGVGATTSNVQSISSMADVSILGGLVRAARVIAVTSASQLEGVVTTNCTGSAFEGLIVNGVALGDVAPNTRINLPGTGYVLLNEQVTSATGIAVNMIHVVLTAPLTGTVIGRIKVGASSSGL